MRPRIAIWLRLAAAFAIVALFILPLFSAPAGAEGPPPASYDWYRYQGAPESGPSASVNCEVTSMAMSIQYARDNLKIPIATIRQFIGRDGATSTADAVRSLNNWGVPHRAVHTVQDIMDALNRGHIVMVGLMMDRISLGADYQRGYSSPEYRFGRYYPFEGAHSVVVKGVTPDKGWFIVYDPNVWDGNPTYWYSDRTPKGKDRYYPVGEFKRAMDALGDSPKGLEVMAAPVLKPLPAPLAPVPAQQQIVVKSVAAPSPAVRETAAVRVVSALTPPPPPPPPIPTPPPVVYPRQSGDLGVLGSLGSSWKSVTFTVRLRNPRSDSFQVAQLGVQGRDPSGREFFTAHGPVALPAGGEVSLAIPMAVSDKGTWSVHRILYFGEGEWRELAAANFLQKAVFRVQ